MSAEYLRPARRYLSGTIFSLLFAVLVLAACGNPEKEKLQWLEKGKILYSRGRYTEAVSEYRKALNIDPEMAEVHYEMGRCYVGLSYFDEAIRAFNDARILDPDLALGCLFEIARAYAAKEEPAMARQTCKEALLIDSENIDVLVFLGGLDLEDGRPGDAQIWFEKALAADPNRPESRIMLAEIALQLGDHLTAEQHLRKVVSEVDPENNQARLVLAKLYRFSEREEEAIRLLREILDSDSGHVGARGALAEVYFSLNRLDDAEREAATLLNLAPQLPDAHSLMGVILLHRGDNEGAVSHLARAASYPAASANVHYLHGLVLTRLNALAQATSALKTALALGPDNVHSRLMLAQVLLADGSFEEAEGELRAILAREPENKYALEMLVRAGALRRAFRQIDSLITSKGLPEEATVKLKEGVRAFRAGDLSESEAACEQLIQLVPHSPLPWNLRGLIFLRRQRLPEAVESFNQALNVDPAFAATYINLANLYLAIGSKEDAVQCYTKALRLAPQDRTLRLKFARALAQMGLRREAESFVTGLVKAEPEWTAYRLVLVNLLLSEKQYDHAHSELGEILKIDAGNSVAAALLAETFAREGNLMQAAEQFALLSGGAGGAVENYRLKLAVCKLAMNLPEEAEAVLAGVLEEDDKRGSVEFLRGLIRQAQGQFAEAEALFSARRREARREESYDLILANLYAARGNLEAASNLISRSGQLSRSFKNNYTQLFRKDTVRKEALFKLSLATVLSGVGWNRIAIKLLEDAGPDFLGNPGIREMRGRLFEREMETEKAVEEYRAALAVDEAYTPALYRLGVLSLGTGKQTESERYFASILAYEADSAPAILSLARVQQSLGKDAEAIKNYRRVVRMHPGFPPAMNNLAWLLAKNPETLAEALKLAELAVSSNPERADFLDTLGWVHFLRADYKSAGEVFEKAALFNTLNPSIRYHRGMTFFKLGEKPKALAEFNAADSSTLPFPERELNTKMIRELS